MLDSCSSLRRSRTHLIHGFLSPLKPITKRHLNRFGSFYRAHNCDKQTDRPCYSVCNNRLHLHNSTTMRPKNGLCAPAHPHLGIVCHGASSWYHLHAYKIWRLCFQFEDSIFSRSKIMQKIQNVKIRVIWEWLGSLKVQRRCTRYRDGAGNTTAENSSVFSLIRMR